MSRYELSKSVRISVDVCPQQCGICKAVTVGFAIGHCMTSTS
jgi:hypothetical protein